MSMPVEEMRQDLQDEYSATWMSQSNIPLALAESNKGFSRDGAGLAV